MLYSIAHVTLYELGTGAALFLAGALCGVLVLGLLRRGRGGAAAAAGRERSEPVLQPRSGASIG